MSDSFITQCLQFKRPGPKNTAATLEHAAARARELGIKKIVLASNTGKTVREALNFFDPAEFELISVGQVVGFSEPNVQAMVEADRAELLAKGIKIVNAAHAFGSVGRGVRNKVGSFQVDEIMAFTLRLMGQGYKVCIEIGLMAVDAGLVRTDEDIICIAGTGRGADTAVALRPSNSHTCLETKVHEIIAKPWNP